MWRDRLGVAYRAALPGVLVAAAVANLLLTVGVPSIAQPIWSHPGPSLEAATQTQRTNDHRFRFHLLVGDIVDGGTLVVGDDVALDQRVARGIGGYTVAVVPGPLLLPDEVEAAVPDPATGTIEVAGALVDYRVVDGPLSDLAWLATHDGGLVVVPASLHPVPGAGGG
jgi:hypothetical protein